MHTRHVTQGDQQPGGLAEASVARMRALVDAVTAITRVQDDPEQMLEQIVEAARTVSGAEYAALGIVGNDGRTLDAFLHTGMDPATVERIGNLPTGHGILGAVIVEGRALRLPDLALHPASQGFPPNHPPMRSFLGVPIRSGEKVLGHLYMTNKDMTDEEGGAGFTDTDEALITALAGQASIAIEMSTRYDRERELTRRLQRLVEVNTVLTTERRVDHALQQIVNAAADLVDATYVGLGVLGEGRDSFSSFIHTGMDPELVEVIGDLPVGRGVMRAVMVGGRAIRLKDLGSHPASVGFPENHPVMRTFLGVPVAHQGRVIGDLYLTDKRGGQEFTEVDELIATALASQAAVIVTNADAYERERALVAELRSADEAKEAFVHHVAHELKTPLVTIRGSLQALEMGRKGLDEAQRTQLEQMAVRQLDTMMAMVNNLLELASIESGRSPLVLEPVSLGPVIEAALASAPPPDGTVVDLDPCEDDRVTADHRYVERIVSNLLTNAYRHGGPHVTVRTTSDDDGVTLSVIDDGDGVPASLVPTLFERFVRGRQSRGTGLGLGLVKALAERFGGTVSYRPADNGGARFDVRLRHPDATTAPDVVV